jgi:MFS family permease
VTIKQGLRQNLGQFVILIVVNAFVGAMIGLEQTVVPLIGKNEFGIDSNAIILSFIASFGLVKAILNLYAGSLAERWGRKKVLILGWSFGIPVPFILLAAPDWNWIILANVLLGVNQALAWSMTVNMKIDLVGREKRGLALGLNEFAGYLSVAVVGFATGYLASIYGLKPYPFYIGIAFAVVGTLLSAILVRDTRQFVQLELQGENQDSSPSKSLTFKQVFVAESHSAVGKPSRTCQQPRFWRFMGLVYSVFCVLSSKRERDWIPQSTTPCYLGNTPAWHWLSKRQNRQKIIDL